MAGSYEDYKTYLGDLYKDVLKKTQTINYTPRSDGQLKAMIQGYLRPGLDKNIAAREQQGRMNNSAVDADAAARGMGGSTWLTDMKNRQNNAVSSDISGLRSDYTTNLFNSLMSKISEQDANMMQVQQFNANAKNKALDRAFAATNANINSWSRRGGGGGVQPPPDVTDPAFGAGDQTGKKISGIAKNAVGVPSSVVDRVGYGNWVSTTGTPKVKAQQNSKVITVKPKS